MQSKLPLIIRQTLFPSSLNMDTYWAQFHGIRYGMRKIAANYSRKFCANGKPISQVSKEFWLVHLRTFHN